MKVFWFSWTNFQPLLAPLICLLSTEEKQKGDRLRFEHLQQRYQINHGVLRIILAQYLNCEPSVLNFTYTEKGKPLIVSFGHLHQLEFNLSHSQDLALIGINYAGKIGVDIEYRREIEDCLSLAKRFFSAQDYLFLAQTSGEAQQKLFFQLWTAKEAYLKATGKGISGGLDQVQIGFSPTRFIALEGSFDLAQQWHLFSFELNTDYQAAIAVPKTDFKPRTGELKIEELTPDNLFRPLFL
ncbi:MAG: 4'-phosphopantetheinyl transferase family protein [Microcystaceae cyanobacterium]